MVACVCVVYFFCSLSNRFFEEDAVGFQGALRPCRNQSINRSLQCREIFLSSSFACLTRVHAGTNEGCTPVMLQCHVVCYTTLHAVLCMLGWEREMHRLTVHRHRLPLAPRPTPTSASNRLSLVSINRMRHHTHARACARSNAALYRQPSTYSFHPPC